MLAQSLNGLWELSVNGCTESVPATVPGSVHTALLKAGKIKDPFWRDNEKHQMWIGESDWLYQRTFTVDESLQQHQIIKLRCYGLDTIATIFLNGTKVAETDNMFRTYEFYVKPLLKPS